MKNTIKAAAVIALSLFAAACAKETKIESPNEGQKLHFIVNTAENVVVKSFLDNNNDGTYTPKWSKDDELAIFVGAIDKNTKPTGVLTNANAQGPTASFGGTITGIPTEGTFKSFAPASAFAISYNGGNVGITLAESQKPSSLTIDEACDILVAKEANYTADANDKVTVNDLFFKRMFSVVKVALKGPATLNGEKVQKFSLTAPEGTILTGRAAINLSTATIDKWNIPNKTVTATYTTDAPVFGSDTPSSGNVVWLVVNPGTIASGAKVTFAGETAGYTFSKEVILSNDLMFPESQLAVINLNLSDEHCTKKATPAAASWIATDLADIAADDEVVITMAKGESVYAMTSDKGTNDNPQAVLVTVKDGELSATPANNLVWNIANDNGNLTIYPNGQTDKWLYSATSGTNVRVGNSKTNNIFTLDATTKYLKNTGTSRYLGVYNNDDWRCYANATSLAGQTLRFYVKGGPIDNTIPTLSVDKTSKTWAADAMDAFVVKVTVNSEGGDWMVTPETLSWATIAVDKTAGTITVTPNRANETETANEATLTVTHASDASLTKEITLTQKAAGGIDYSKVYTSNVKTLNKKVKIGEVEYDAVQVGTGSKSGSFSFNVPVGTTKLHLHVVGWKGEGGKIHTIATSVGTISSTSITTVADTGATSSSPFTLSKTDYSGKDYYFEFTLTNITKESTITISNSAGKSRGVYFGINAE